MNPFVVPSLSRVQGTIILPGDKSIACRSVIIGALSPRPTEIKNFPDNKDCQYAINAFRKLGIGISRKPRRSSSIAVFGRGLSGLKKPKGDIFVGDSGTTFRLLLGVLAGQNFRVRLSAGKSLSSRPMLRVNEPLRMMGARIKARVKRQKAMIEEYPPITIKGGNLRGIIYEMPVASAQVKSAILLAGLYTKGITRVYEPVKTRDHTERMLKLFKADIKVNHNTIVIKGNKELNSPQRLYIPADISSASFFIVLATILSGSQILIKNVGLNPSRTGVIRILKRMGADIRVSRRSFAFSGFEPVGDILIKSSILKGTIIKKVEIPTLIDEIPILMVAACYARGETVFEGVSELKVKETDRLRSMSENLKKMGAAIRVFRMDGTEKIIIEGVKRLFGARVRSFGDHRTAMSMVIAGLKADGKTVIDDVSCIGKSFPGFLSLLKSIAKYA